MVPAHASHSGAEPRSTTPPTRQPPPENTTTSGVIYTCPMHPEVRQNGPGACPKCGDGARARHARAGGDQDRIHLPDAPGDRARRAWRLPDLRHGARAANGRRRRRGEPRTASTCAGDSSGATILGAPVFVLAMSDMVLGAGLGGRIDLRLTNWLGLALATPVVWWAGWPFFERGWASIVNRSANMFTLIALGHRGGVPLQRGGHDRARAVPGRLPHARRRGDRTSTPRS